VIELICPNCLKVGETPRQSYDPVTAVRAKILCPECCDKTCAHEPETIYLDRFGYQVFFNPTPEEPIE
jgi:hypothetical protein